MLTKIQKRLSQRDKVRAAVKLARRHEIQQATLEEFVKRCGLEPNRVTTQLTEAVNRANAGEELRLVVATPPRHGKTQTLLSGFAWLLTQDPSKTHAYATYGADLSTSKSRLARQYALEHGVRLADDSKSVREWRTTAGGGLLATGVGGPLTGQGVSGLAVVDDPFKNMQEARSATYRERVWEWFNAVMYTRLEPGSSLIVVATRWHPDDLSGRLVKDGWECINLPAIDDAGLALWPERFPVERLREIEGQIGTFAFSALYQGQPIETSGGVFGEPTYYDELPNSYRAGIAYDAAYTPKSSADYSVILSWREAGGKLYLTDMWREQVSSAKFVRALKNIQTQHRAPAYSRIGGTEKAMVAWLQQEGIDVRASTTVGNKLTNALPVAAAWDRGDILVPKDAPWLDALLQELGEFTGVGDAHDDIVDTIVTAWLSRNKQNGVVGSSSTVMV